MRTVVTMLLLCGAAAFGQELPDAPSFSSTNQSPTGNKAFWITAGVYSASIAGDAITKAPWVGQTSGCSREGIPPGLSGRPPKSARSSLTMAEEFAIASVLSYQFKKHNVHIGRLQLWELPFAARTYVHSQGIIKNLAVCH